MEPSTNRALSSPSAWLTATMRRGAVVIGALAVLAGCREKPRERRARPAPAPLALPEIDARWTTPAAAARFVVIDADGRIRGGAWTGDPGGGVAIVALDEQLSGRLSAIIGGDGDDATEEEEEPPPEEPEALDDGGFPPPTPEELAWQAERAWLRAHDDDRVDVLDGERNDRGGGFGYGVSGGGVPVVRTPDLDAQHGAAGLVVREPRPKSTLVLAARTAPATTLLTAVDVLAADDEVFLGVAGPTEPVALAVWFRSLGHDNADDVIPVVALGGDGATVRASDSEPVGAARWVGGRIDAAALAAAYQAVVPALDVRWRDGVLITIDPTITVAQLLDVVTVLLAEGVTAVGVRDFSPSWQPVLLGAAEGAGDLDRPVVRRYLRRRRPRMAACYEQARALTPSLARTTVEARFRVQPNGTLAEIHVTSAEQPALAACVEAVILGLELPKPKGGAAYLVTRLPIAFRAAP